METTIIVQRKSVYGVDKIYPLSENAHIICDMLHQKTLTLQDVEQLKKLGYTVTVEPSNPEKL